MMVFVGLITKNLHSTHWDSHPKGLHFYSVKLLMTPENLWLNSLYSVSVQTRYLKVDLWSCPQLLWMINSEFKPLFPHSCMIAEDCWPASGFTRMSAALLWDIVSEGLVILGDRNGPGAGSWEMWAKKTHSWHTGFLTPSCLGMLRRKANSL